MRLRDLQLGKSASKRVTFTRLSETGKMDVTVLLVPLTNVEVADASADSQTGIPSAAVLAIALRDPDQPDQAWATESEIVSFLTVREIAMLMDTLIHHQEAVSPSLRSMTAKTFERLLDDIEVEAEDFLISLRATKAAELSAYYGLPSSTLSDGQVMYFLGLLRAESKAIEKFKTAEAPK